MKVEASFIKDLKMVDPHLSVIWNSQEERFQITWKDPRTKKIRQVMTIENDDGSFRPPDSRAILYCSRVISWKTLYGFPESEDMFNYLLGKQQYRQKKQRELSREKTKWWNKEHRKEWKAALENAQRGIFSLPQERERKIYIT